MVAQRQEESDECDQQATGDEKPQPAGALGGLFSRRGITHATWLLSLLRHPDSEVLYNGSRAGRGDVHGESKSEVTSILNGLCSGFYSMHQTHAPSRNRGKS